MSLVKHLIPFKWVSVFAWTELTLHRSIAASLWTLSCLWTPECVKQRCVWRLTSPSHWDWSQLHKQQIHIASQIHINKAPMFFPLIKSDIIWRPSKIIVFIYSRVNRICHQSKSFQECKFMHLADTYKLFVLQMLITVLVPVDFQCMDISQNT